VLLLLLFLSCHIVKRRRRKEMIGRRDVYIGETRKRRGLDLLDNCAHFPVLNVWSSYRETQRVW
jgi:hypothetical protein